jgi:hypothetical protein
MNGLSPRTAPDDHSPPRRRRARRAASLRVPRPNPAKNHHAESRHDQVEAFRLERVGLRVGADEGCRHACVGPRAPRIASVPRSRPDAWRCGFRSGPRSRLSGFPSRSHRRAADRDDARLPDRRVDRRVARTTDRAARGRYPRVIRRAVPALSVFFGVSISSALSKAG